MKNIGLYVHIPFCRKKCYYCDFCSYVQKEDIQEKYIKALEREIIHISARRRLFNRYNIHWRWDSISNKTTIYKANT